MKTQQSMSCNEPIRFCCSGWKWRELPSRGSARVFDGHGHGWGGGILTVERVEQMVKSEFVCLSFTSNSSLKPVRGSRSPLIRSSTVFALLLWALSSGGPTVWVGCRSREPVLIYLIQSPPFSYLHYYFAVAKVCLLSCDLVKQRVVRLCLNFVEVQLC